MGGLFRPVMSHTMAFPCDEAVPCPGPLGPYSWVAAGVTAGRPCNATPAAATRNFFVRPFVHSWHLSKMSGSMARAPIVSIITLSSKLTTNFWHVNRIESINGNVQYCHVSLPEGNIFLQGLVPFGGSPMHHLIRVQWSHRKRGLILTRLYSSQQRMYLYNIVWRSG